MRRRQAGVCRICGCTDHDCRQCIELTGEPCFWVEPDLCSVCAALGERFGQVVEEFYQSAAKLLDEDAEPTKQLARLWSLVERFRGRWRVAERSGR